MHILINFNTGKYYQINFNTTILILILVNVAIQKLESFGTNGLKGS